MGSAISFCNNKKYTHTHIHTHTSTYAHTRTHIHTKLQQRLINSHYETELRHLAPQSSRKEDGLKYFMHHQMSNIGQVLCPKPALFENMWANTPWTSALRGKSTVCTYGHSCLSLQIRPYRMLSAAFAENNRVWLHKYFDMHLKAFTAKEDPWVQHSWSKQWWVGW